jgi:outer membrane biosynthesis protein TonB
MAKARDLAALAGLAGLAYAYNNKNNAGKENDALAESNRISKLSDESNTLARVNREKTPGQGAMDDTNAGVLNALSAPKAAPNAQASNQGVLPQKTLTPEPEPKPEPVTTKPVVPAQKKNIVSKKQLEDYKKKFGQDKTLRDYMNTQSGKVRKMASGGMTSSASSRGDGISTKGKTRGKIC